jgi:hypothetical protein
VRYPAIVKPTIKRCVEQAKAGKARERLQSGYAARDASGESSMPAGKSQA